MVFNSVWTLLVIAYVGLTPIYFTRIFHKLVSLGLNAVTMLFWFAGSIALAVAFGGPYKCGADTICGSTTAAIAFGFFLWYVLAAHCNFELPKTKNKKQELTLCDRAIFTFLTVIDCLDSFRNRGASVKGPAAYPGA